MIPLAETATRKHRGIISSSGATNVDKSHVDLAVAAGSSAACFAASTTRSIAAVSPFHHPRASFSLIPQAYRAQSSQSQSMSEDSSHGGDYRVSSNMKTRLGMSNSNTPKTSVHTCTNLRNDGSESNTQKNRFKRSLAVFLSPPTIRSTLSFVLISTLVFGVLFVAQSMYIIFHHRAYFGERTPLPISPISGLVVAMDRNFSPHQFNADHSWNRTGGRTSSSTDASCHLISQNKCDRVGENKGQFNHTSYTWKRFSTQPDLIAARSRALTLQPLHILVIGDSMARGVGVGKSCIPVIPEKLALYLSKALGGRPVYWTVRGEPGANAGRIVRELQQQETATARTNTEPIIATTTSPNSSDLSSWDENIEKDIWIQRLKEYKEIHQGYDVAVVFTGMNDLKGIIFPFILQGQDHLEAKKRGGGYLGELQRLLHELGFKMKRGLLEYLQKVKSKVDAHRDDDDNKPWWSSKVRNKISESIDDLSARIDHISLKNPDPKLEESTTVNDTISSLPQRPPLVIFPMLPIQMCPGLQYGPCRYIGLGLQTIFEGMKRKLTRMYPDLTLHLNGMQMVNFSRRFLNGDRMIHDSDIALSLIEIDEGRCRHVEETMHSFYSSYWSKMHFPNEIGEDASRWDVWSPDTIHPNDNGYDMIGEFIGEETIRKWNI